MNQMRQEKILNYIRKKQIVTIKELQALHPEVTLMTIHRDLDALVRQGEIVKVRGGARLVSHPADPRYDERLQANTRAKKIMAEKALPLIKPDMSIFFDAGTSNLMLASILPDIEISVFTTAPNIALEMCRLTNPAISLCGGSLNKSNQALSGYHTIEMLKQINIDLAFIGVSGCSAENGFTCGKESEMMVKQLVIEKARASVVLCDSSKLTKLMPYTFARLEDISYFITDTAPSPDFVSAAQAADTIIL